MKKFDEVTYKPQDISVQELCNMIDKGYELQEIDDLSSLSDTKKMKYTNALIIAPDYQRDYRSTIRDESSLIESIYVGIPIPAVFLSNDQYEGVTILNVVDGQHRLRAFHRFCKDQFRLKGLEITKKLNDYKFSELTFADSQKIYASQISAIVFTGFPGLEFELEIFNRYNKGTKPLSPQEIRHAVYNSKINHYINSFVKKLSSDKTNPLSYAYNFTKDRYQKKRIQESLFVMLSILEYGINTKYNDSPSYAEEYMKEKRTLEIEKPLESLESFEKTKIRFEMLNSVMVEVCNYVEYPFSKEVYGISSKNYKFQISVAMIWAAIFNHLFEMKIPLEKISEKKYLNQLLNVISQELGNSYLEDPAYNASSTNSLRMNEFINEIKPKIDILYR